ncbi:1,4-dihydroxy-2-naphthoate polyprenyltransferase [hydrothermal vent metagenome]|uniref:1,4-dihydroxy-2-naphthoate polyprenyltransferase n=1 Tax=hydrothermal vent metagenome TaxID=652676 RepID=A0A3B0RSC2_9ZZZZ
MAARPATLLASVAPVLIGTASAWSDGVFAVLPFVVVLVAALAIQIGVNFANDLADAQKGADTEARIGPQRAVASGVISMSDMKRGIAVAFGVAGVGGIYLIWYAGWPIFVIGVVSIIAALGYTNGPIPYGYYGLGELFVFVFFGIVATVGTRFVFANPVPPEAWAGGVVMGFLAAAILEANNIRDIDTDREAGKRTLAVMVGRTWARRLFAATLILAFVTIIFSVSLGVLPPMTMIALVVAPLSIPLIRTVYTETAGPPLIGVLKGTAQLQMFAGLLLSLGIVF